jgi:hypothetical protein
MKDSSKLLIALVIFLLGLVGCQEKESQLKHASYHAADAPDELIHATF